MNFSILISVYKQDNYLDLEACFNSILINQDVKPSEIVLIKDGLLSEDLNRLIEHWCIKFNNLFKIIELGKNIGLGKALNEGLKHCSYDWVFRMDTDDICTPDRFQKQVEFIQNNPDVVLFGGQIQEFGSELNDLHKIRSVPTSDVEIRKSIGKRNPFNHMTVAYRKDVIMQLGGYKHHLFMEDYNLWLRVIGAGYKVANLPDVLLYARIGNGMHARRRGWQYIKSEKQLLDLKLKLKLQSPLSAWTLFGIRSIFRLLPTQLVGVLYNSFLRKNHK